MVQCETCLNYLSALMMIIGALLSYSLITNIEIERAKYTDPFGFETKYSNVTFKKFMSDHEHVNLVDHYKFFDVRILESHCRVLFGKLTKEYKIITGTISHRVESQYQVQHLEPSDFDNAWNLLLTDIYRIPNKFHIDINLANNEEEFKDTPDWRIIVLLPVPSSYSCCNVDCEFEHRWEWVFTTKKTDWGMWVY